MVLAASPYPSPASELADANGIVGSGIRATLEEAMPGNIAIYSERMDVSALPEERYFEDLRDAYRKRYAGERKCI